MTVRSCLSAVRTEEGVVVRFDRVYALEEGNWSPEDRGSLDEILQRHGILRRCRGSTRA